MLNYAQNKTNKNVKKEQVIQDVHGVGPLILPHLVQKVVAFWAVLV